jgi:hypothetical protein
MTLLWNMVSGKYSRGLAMIVFVSVSSRTGMRLAFTYHREQISRVINARDDREVGDDAESSLNVSPSCQALHALKLGT